jgi:hypothetical protein
MHLTIKKDHKKEETLKSDIEGLSVIIPNIIEEANPLACTFVACLPVSRSTFPR